MPRFYVDTFNDVDLIDHEGTDLPSREAVHQQVHQTLASMMRDERDGRTAIQFRAEVRDESGKRIMKATLLLMVEMDA